MTIQTFRLFVWLRRTESLPHRSLNVETWVKFTKSFINFHPVTVMLLLYRLCAELTGTVVVQAKNRSAFLSWSRLRRRSLKINPPSTKLNLPHLNFSTHVFWNTMPAAALDPLKLVILKPPCNAFLPYHHHKKIVFFQRPEYRANHFPFMTILNGVSHIPMLQATRSQKIWRSFLQLHVPFRAFLFWNFKTYAMWRLVSIHQLWKPGERSRAIINRRICRLTEWRIEFSLVFFLGGFQVSEFDQFSLCHEERSRHEQILMSVSQRQLCL